MPIIFNGDDFARQKEAELQKEVQVFKKQGLNPKIAAIFFQEDEGSCLYTRLKKEAAQRVGIGYDQDQFSFADPSNKIQARIKALNQDQSIQGIIIQKPTFRAWQHFFLNHQAQQNRIAKKQFQSWWQKLVSLIDEKKDVDGLHPNTFAAIKAGNWQKQGKVLPATCQAVLEILTNPEIVKFSAQKIKNKQRILLDKKAQIIILGRSVLLGQPLYYQLKNQGYFVELIGREDLAQRIKDQRFLTEADIIITATGRPKLITADFLKKRVIIIDAGEPQGDVDFFSVIKKTSFITPVPGGVGPVTIVSLLKNCLTLSKQFFKLTLI